MAEVIYLLCAVTSTLCALLLTRSYMRRGSPLLMWSAAGFVGLALNNILLFVDLAIVPAADLSLWRTASALAGVFLLVAGLIWEDQ